MKATRIERAAAELAFFFRTQNVRPMVVSDAPESLAALQADPRVAVKTGTMVVPVSGEHCETTLYADPVDNHWARAWHDSVHLALGTEFDEAGELATAREQVYRATLAGLSGDSLILLTIDTAGQTMFYARWGAFPSDQKAFTLAAFHGTVASAIAEKAGI